MTQISQLDSISWLHQQRHRAINAQLALILVLGAPGLAEDVWRLLSGFGYTFALPYYLIVYILVAALFFLRRLSDQWRALAFSSILYAFGVFAFYSGWLAGSGRVALLALIVVTAFFASPHAGFFAAGLSIATYAFFALAFNGGWLVLRSLPDPTSPPPMLIEGIGFVISIGIVVISQWFFAQALLAAARANREARGTRALLTERAKELEVINLLLSNSRSSFYNIVERSADGVVVIDRNKNVCFVNHAAEAFFQRSRDESLGNPAPFPVLTDEVVTLDVFHQGTEKGVAELRVVKTEWEGKPAFLALLRDVTEREKTEAALRESEALYRRAIEAAGAVPYYQDYARNTYAFMGSGIQKMTGYAPEEMTPQVWNSLVLELSLLGEAAQLDRQEALRRARAGQSKVWQADARIRARDGQVRWVNDAAVGLFDERGIPRGAIGILQDITERKQAEEALRESEHKFRTFVEQSSEGLVLSDEQGVVIEWNRAQEELSGIPHHEVLGIPLWDAQSRMVIPAHRSPEGYAALQTMILAALQAGSAPFLDKPQEIEVYRTDGRQTFVQQTAFPIKTDKGYRLGSISRNITERKRAEEALRASEARFRALTENSSDMIMLLNPDATFRYASSSVQRLMGYAPESLTGRNILELVHPDDLARVQSETALLMQGHPGLREYTVARVRHADGTWHFHEAVGTNLLDDPAVAAVVMNSRDITVRKQAEAEREKLITELETKNAELERFTYSVSHDLKSPLITIRGFLGFLEKDAIAGDAERLKSDIARITEATTKMHRLLDELLELSRVGRLINPPEDVPFESIAGDAIEAVRGRIEKRGVQVEVADTMPIVSGDRTRLSEVVQNLVDNAVKFMGNQPNPRIEIGTRGTESGGKAILFVRDNGIGIEPRYQEKVFGLFDKLDPRSEGTGVGLTLVKRIVEVHGGRIWVESQLGQGATFCFTLPTASVENLPPR